MNTHEPSTFEERRQASRFGREFESDYAVLRVGTAEARTWPVHDESLGGISLVLDETLTLPVGAEVTIDYGNSQFHGVVIHRRSTGENQTVIAGFQLESKPQ
jgi:hypothetical protein